MRAPCIAILTQPPLVDWAESIVESLSRQGANPLIVESLDDLSGKAWDAGWLRIVPDLSSAAIPDYWRAAERLEADGVSLLNSTHSHLRAYDKVFSGELFKQADLPTPKTWRLDDSLPTELPDRLICKPITTSKGFGVIEVPGYQQALDHQQELGIPCLLQEKIDVARCIRIVCTLQTTIRAYEKHVPSGGLVASVSLGAEMLNFEPSDQMSGLAQAMVGAVGGGLMGVDLLEDRGGKLWALETNASFGFDPQDQTVADSIAGEILNLVSRSP